MIIPKDFYEDLFKQLIDIIKKIELFDDLYYETDDYIKDCIRTILKKLYKTIENAL